MRLRATDRLANRLTPGAGTFVVAPLALTAAGIGGAAALPYVLPGTVGGNIIGTTAFGDALNHAIKYGTGKTMGEHAVNAAHYLGIPKSLWGDFGIQMLGDMPIYVGGEAIGKAVTNAVINAGRTLSREALLQMALDNAFKGIPTNPTTKDLAKAMNESLDKQTLYTPSTLNSFDNPYQITRVAGDKIRLRLPSHTQEKPREVVLVPHGNNQYELHIRTWDGDHIPANLDPKEKLALFESVYNELPEGAEILFPKSSVDYPATRGTVAALTHLSRDPRFQRGNTTGTLIYTDKNGNLQTFTGNSFIKQSNQSPETSEGLFLFKLQKPLDSHLQGEDAVKMFKEYGGRGEPIPENSINGEQLRKYVQEARERYGLIGNENITDEEIAQALYKHVKELGGNTAAINALGEPQLLFRGDTKRYTLLKERLSPEEIVEKSGTMDNSLGNLFLGEMPGTAGKHSLGIERYLVTGRDFRGNKILEGSGTGSRAILPDGSFATEMGGDVIEFPEGSYPLVTYNRKYGPITYYKLPASSSESGVNDINAFVVRTPHVRDASKEISVLNDAFMVRGGPKTEYHGPKQILDENGHSLLVDENGNVVTERQAMAQHYRYVLDDAKSKKQGLLKSKGETDGKPDNYLRDEHSDYTYFVLPNFNILGAKHILPFDLRMPRNWNDSNIYRSLLPFISTSYGLYQLNQPTSNRKGGKLIPRKRYC